MYWVYILVASFLVYMPLMVPYYITPIDQSRPGESYMPSPFTYYPSPEDEWNQNRMCPFNNCIYRFGN